MMERIGYDLKHGYIYGSQNERGTLVHVHGIGWIHKTA